MAKRQQVCTVVYRVRHRPSGQFLRLASGPFEAYRLNENGLELFETTKEFEAEIVRRQGAGFVTSVTTVFGERAERPSHTYDPDTLEVVLVRTTVDEVVVRPYAVAFNPNPSL